jgi:hypothetical protein
MEVDGAQQPPPCSDLYTLLELHRMVVPLEQHNPVTVAQCASLAVCLYNVRYHDVQCELAGPDDDPNRVARFDRIIDNAAALEAGRYLMDADLLARTKWPITLEKQDFGITIVTMYFGKFFAAQQYPLYALIFRSVDELAIMERTLVNHNQAKIQLPYNLAIDEKYSLLKMRYSGRDPVTVSKFHTLIDLMRKKGLQVETFIEEMRPLLPMLVESFYMFTSLTRDLKTIHECRLSKNGILPYTFRGYPVGINSDKRLFWFEMPLGAIRFAYSQQRRNFAKMVVDTPDPLAALQHVPHQLILGFVTKDGPANVLRIEPPPNKQQPPVACVWRHTIEMAQKHGLKCPLTNGPFPEKLARIHYVTDSSPNVFKAKK